MVTHSAEPRNDGPLVSFVALRPSAARVRSLQLALSSQQRWELVLVGAEGVETVADTRLVHVPADVGVPFSIAVSRGVAAAGGTFVSVLPENGLPSSDALATIDDWLLRTPDASVVYTDESSVRRDGGIEVVRKQGPAPERLRCQFYFGDLLLFRRDLLEGLGGFSDGIDGAELYDFTLRASRSGAVVLHIPRVLFDAPAVREIGAFAPVSLGAVRRVLETHLAATGGGTVLEVSADGVHETIRPIHGAPLISIVIPTQARLGTPLEPGGAPHSYLLHALRGLVEKTTYENFEVVLVVDSDPDAAVIDEATRLLGDRLVIVDYDLPFNFAAKANRGVLNAVGEYILMLNDDVEIITPGWIESLLSLAQLPGAGMAGCMLYYEDDTVQHGGHHYWMGSPTHIGLQVPRGEAGPEHAFEVEREVIGVTAACSLFPREVYLEVGGMTTLLPGAFNDVDFCLKVAERGYRAYWTPRAELYHFESKTRDARVRAYELETLGRRWRHRLHQPQYWPFPE
ncbi:glycosyltransferase family 2 protein [Plantibacter sp. CFBP 13570]|uniref:glycosyltransferase family 2 protein n=1 Tax=Plantibacter sp. CFBP 13570 TaxID=2775272 RepID=UPI00193093EF|nr:glycosyltransferase [Plantibacter sp. CFBP 13570]MBD8533856.1 glycosyltransferase [Plantibacter sp. CFBP 13570]